MVTVKNDAHRKHTAAKNHGVLFVENRVVKADFRSNREALLFEEEVDIIFSHPLLFFCSAFLVIFVMSKQTEKEEEKSFSAC